MDKYLDAVLVDVDVVACAASLCLAEDNHLLEEKYVSETLLASVPHNELSLSHQHALLLQIQLKHTGPSLYLRG